MTKKVTYLFLGLTATVWVDPGILPAEVNPELAHAELQPEPGAPQQADRQAAQVRLDLGHDPSANN